MTEADIQVLRQMKSDLDRLQWFVKNIRGDGVINGPNGIYIKAITTNKPTMPLSQGSTSDNSLGEYKGMVHSMVSDAVDGWEFVQFIPYVP